MALNNANNKHAVLVNLGSITADAEVPAMYAGEDMVIDSVHIINGAEIVASDSNYIELELKSGDDVIATYDSRAAAQGGLDALIAKAMVLDPEEADIAQGSSLSIDYDETGSIGMTNAQVVIWLRTK